MGGAPQGGDRSRLGAVASGPSSAADRSVTMSSWARTHYTAFVRSNVSAPTPCEWRSRTALSRRSTSHQCWPASCSVHFEIRSSSLKSDSTQRRTRSCGRTEPTSIPPRFTTGLCWLMSSARAPSGGVRPDAPLLSVFLQSGDRMAATATASAGSSPAISRQWCRTRRPGSRSPPPCGSPKTRWT